MPRLAFVIILISTALPQVRKPLPLDDIRTLVSLLPPLEKSEFETTTEYKLRVLNRRIPERDFAFLLDRDRAPFTYWADDGEMKAAVTPQPGGPIILKKTELSRSQYPGSNAFGAKVMITRTLNQEYSLDVTSSSIEFPPGGPVRFAWRMIAQDAKVSKQFLRLVLVGRAAGKEVKKGTTFDKATFDSPIESITMYTIVPFSVREVRVIDTRDGAVVTRFTKEHRK